MMPNDYSPSETARMIWTFLPGIRDLPQDKKTNLLEVLSGVGEDLLVQPMRERKMSPQQLSREVRQDAHQWGGKFGPNINDPMRNSNREPQELKMDHEMFNLWQEMQKLFLDEATRTMPPSWDSPVR